MVLNMGCSISACEFAFFTQPQEISKSVQFIKKYFILDNMFLNFVI